MKPARAGSEPQGTTSCDSGSLEGRKLPGQDSNLDKENQKAFQDQRKSLADNISGQGPVSFVRPFAQTGPDQVPDGLPASAATDPDLARIFEAWPALSAPIKAAVLALVGTAR